MRYRINLCILFALILLTGIRGRHKELPGEQSHEELIRLALPRVDISTATSLLNDAGNLIHHRYELNRHDSLQLFLGVVNMPARSWDIQKFKIASKMLESSSSKQTTNPTYLMVFGGSSVTAGHDNYYNQSHPFVFSRRLKPIFAALGINLLVRNTAQGMNNCKPYMYCYESMGGEGADFVGWEQSFNCGRDRTVFEYVARVAAWSNAVIYYMASGGWMPSGCPPSKTTPARIREEWTPNSDASISSVFSFTDRQVQEFRSLSVSWNAQQASCASFCPTSVTEGYPETAPFGFNFHKKRPYDATICTATTTATINSTAATGTAATGTAATGTAATAGTAAASTSSGIENNSPQQQQQPLCAPVETTATTCAARGGPQWVTAEVSHYANDPHLKGLFWHPPAGIHLLRGEILAYYYLHIVADALMQVKRDVVSGKSISTLLADYRKTLSKLQLPSAPGVASKGGGEMRAASTNSTTTTTAATATAAISAHPASAASTLLRAAMFAGKAHCFTDYAPHYHPFQRLSDLVMFPAAVSGACNISSCRVNNSSESSNHSTTIDSHISASPPSIPSKLSVFSVLHNSSPSTVATPAGTVAAVSTAASTTASTTTAATTAVPQQVPVPRHVPPGWSYQQFHTWPKAETRFGFGDLKPFYQVRIPVNGSAQLYLRVLNVRSGVIMVCGHHQRKGSLAHVHYLLDPHYTFQTPAFTDNSRTTSSRAEIGADRYTAAAVTSGRNMPHTSTATTTIPEMSPLETPPPLPSPPSAFAALSTFKFPQVEAVYFPTQRQLRIPPAQVTDLGGECTQIANVPAGDHVLTIATDPAHPRHVATVSHLIIF